MNTPPCFVDDRPLWDIMMTAYQMPVLSVADEIGLFALLDDEPMTAREIADGVNVPFRSIEAMVDVLLAMGLCAQWSDRIHLTQLARTYLLPDSPSYWGPMLLLWRDTTIDHANVLAAVRAGGSRLPQHGDEDLWSAHQVDREEARRFTSAMNAHSLLPAEAIAALPEFSDTRKLLDVGGGSGCFALAIAKRQPSVTATVMDLPVVTSIAADYIEEAGLSDRVDTMSADMFAEQWPQGYDAVFFSNIFHDWNPEQCLRLAKNAFEALPSGGTIHINEMLKTDGEGGPLTVACYSVDMLIYTEGRQYRACEIKHMLEQVGFMDVRFKPASAYFWLVSASKP